MWESFIIACVIGIIALYLPGFLLNKAARFDTLLSFIMAPASSVLCLSIIGFILYLIPLPISALALLSISIAIPLIIFILSAVRSRNQWETSTVTSANMLTRLPRSMTMFSMMGLQNKFSNWAIMAVYVIVALVCMIYMFFCHMASSDLLPATFVQSLDFAQMSSSAQLGAFSFVVWSPSPETGELIFANQTFLQVLTSAISNLTGIAVTITLKASLTIFIVMVIPLGIYGILSIIFHKNRLLIITGSVLGLSFAAFPWHMLLAIDQLSVIASMAFVPYVFIALLGMTIQSSKLQSKIAYAFLLASSIISILASCPNILFIVLVMCIPYIISRYFCWVNDFGKFNSPIFAKITGVLACLSVCFLVWLIFCNIPITRTMEPLGMPYMASMLQALLSICSLQLLLTAGSQILLGAIVICGAVILLFKKGFRWIVATWAVCALMFMLFALLPDNSLQHAFGFWYVSPGIMAGLLSVASIPLAAVFSATVIRALSAIICEFANIERSKVLLSVIGILYLGAFCACNISIAAIVFDDGTSTNNAIHAIYAEIPRAYSVPSNLPVFPDAEGIIQ